MRPRISITRFVCPSVCPYVTTSENEGNLLLIAINESRSRHRHRHRRHHRHRHRRHRRHHRRHHPAGYCGFR